MKVLSIQDFISERIKVKPVTNAELKNAEDHINKYLYYKATDEEIEKNNEFLDYTTKHNIYDNGNTILWQGWGCTPQEAYCKYDTTLVAEDLFCVYAKIEPNPNNGKRETSHSIFITFETGEWLSQNFNNPDVVCYKIKQKAIAYLKAIGLSVGSSLQSIRTFDKDKLAKDFYKWATDKFGIDTVLEGGKHVPDVGFTNNMLYIKVPYNPNIKSWNDLLALRKPNEMSDDVDFESFVKEDILPLYALPVYYLDYVFTEAFK